MGNELVESNAGLSLDMFAAKSVSSNSYYRSVAFTSRAGVNNLTAAASALLTIVTRINEPLETEEDAKRLQQYLVHEIKAFETNAFNSQLAHDVIMVARYMLCASVDEIVLHAEWRKSVDWQPFSLLALFHEEADGGERFFAILQRLIDSGTQYLELLELAYLILSNGYQGKYRSDPEGEKTLTALVDRLFHAIRLNRGSFIRRLSKQMKQTSTTPVMVSKPFSTPRLIMTSVAILACAYLGFSYTIGMSASPLVQTLKHVNQQEHISANGHIE